jgi:hypothetical protein
MALVAAPFAAKATPQLTTSVSTTPSTLAFHPDAFKLVMGDAWGLPESQWPRGDIHKLDVVYGRARC